MPYREISFIKNQPVHIISRAVEERKIFEDLADCYRFIFQIYAANLGAPAPNIKRQDFTKAGQALLCGEKIPSKFLIMEHPPLIHLLDFSLILTHYHLYLLPNIENAVPVYMKKLNGGFAKYFNLKHSRQGTLFSNRYKSVLVKTDSQSDAVIRYITVINPLDLYQPGWREEGLKNFEEAFRFLQRYQFSSFLERIGKRKSAILATDKIRGQYICPASREDFEKFIKDFLRERTWTSGFQL